MSKKPSILSILNDQSKPLPLDEHQKNLEVLQISVKQILPNENNFYKLTKIEELKESIELFGITHPLLVKRIDNNKYKVISGHRRLLASKLLYEEGKPEFEYVPCTVAVDIEGIKEQILLIHTNSTTRVLSDWEIIEQLSRLKKLFKELKKTNNIPGKVRDLLADTLQVSPTTIGRMETVDKNLIPEFKEELKAKNISMNTAVELSKLDKSKQQEAMQQHKARGSKTQAKHVPIKQETAPTSTDEDFQAAYADALNVVIEDLDKYIGIRLSYKGKQSDTYNQSMLQAYKKIKALLSDELYKL